MSAHIMDSIDSPQPPLDKEQTLYHYRDVERQLREAANLTAITEANQRIAAARGNGPRWKCPHCNGTNVQVSYPTWYRESADFNLEMVETGEGDIQYWFCDDCEESDSGEPEEV